MIATSKTNSDLIDTPISFVFAKHAKRKSSLTVDSDESKTTSSITKKKPRASMAEMPAVGKNAKVPSSTTKSGIVNNNQNGQHSAANAANNSEKINKSIAKEDSKKEPKTEIKKVNNKYCLIYIGAKSCTSKISTISCFSLKNHEKMKKNSIFLFQIFNRFLTFWEAKC